MIKLNYENSGFSKEQINQTAKKLAPRIRELQEVLRKKDYSDDAASIILSRDGSHLEAVKKAARPFKDVELVVVIGMGGASLGALAVQEAVQGKLYHMRKDVTRILFADNVDSDNIKLITDMIGFYISKGKKVLINAISKSGVTTETIANFQIFLQMIKDIFPKTYQEFIVITSDEGSNFDILAGKLGYTRLNTPKYVGDRYSVLSPLGLFPLFVAGIDVEKLLQGASDILKACLDDDYKTNPAAIIAALMYLHYKRGRNIHDGLVWSSDLESVGKWYRQLLAESIGKELNLKSTRKINAGITPTVSVGSTDMHSVGQLDLAGPDNKFFRFVTVENSRSEIIVPKVPLFDLLVRNIQEKSLDDIMHAIIDGVKCAFMKKRRPFIEISLPDKSEYHIGQLLQMEMIEVMLLGYLLDVNPFDQPNVEEYKTETRRILGC